MRRNCYKFKPRKIYTRNYAKYNETNVKEDLKSTQWEQVYTERDINTAWKKFNMKMKKMKRKVSEGYDEIPRTLVIDGAEELTVPLSHLINRCLAHSVFPTAEKCPK